MSVPTPVRVSRRSEPLPPCSGAGEGEGLLHRRLERTEGPPLSFQAVPSGVDPGVVWTRGRRGKVPLNVGRQLLLPSHWTGAEPVKT